METREQRRQILYSAVEQFLDHLEEDFDSDEDYGECELGSVVISSEIATTSLDDEDEWVATTIPTYYCSNENPIWQRGFFELLADYKNISGKLK